MSLPYLIDGFEQIRLQGSASRCLDAAIVLWQYKNGKSIRQNAEGYLSHAKMLLGKMLHGTLIDLTTREESSLPDPFSRTLNKYAVKVWESLQKEIPRTLQKLEDKVNRYVEVLDSAKSEIARERRTTERTRVQIRDLDEVREFLDAFYKTISKDLMAARDFASAFS